MAGHKAIMAPIISEEPSYEENKFKKYRDLFCMCYNFSHGKPLEEEEIVLQDGTIETSDVESKDTFLADVNDHLLHSDGDMCRYFIHKEQLSCLDTDED